MCVSLKEQQKQPSDDTNLSRWNQNWQNNKIGFHRKHVNE